MTRPALAMFTLVVVVALFGSIPAPQAAESLKEPAVVEGDTILAPLRELADWIGAVVEFAPPRITMSKGTVRLELAVGSDVATIAGTTGSRQVRLASPPRVLDDMTFVDLGSIAEAFGLSVDHRRGNGMVAVSAGPRAATLALRHGDEWHLGSVYRYFPIAVGSTWVYQIDTGPALPLFEAALQPGEADRQRFAGVILRLFLKRHPSDDHRSMLRVQAIAPVTKVGPLQVENAIRLYVLEDDEGVFALGNDVYYGLVRVGGLPVVSEITVCQADSQLPSKAETQLYAEKSVFWGGNPDIRIAYVQWYNNGETVRYIGKDAGQPGFEGQSLLHFHREVPPNHNDVPGGYEAVRLPFTEDRWYARDQGLVRLVQKVADEVSMTWTLKSYSVEPVDAGRHDGS